MPRQIHWVSQGGLPNRGSVTFFPRGPDSCALQLAISYELPQVLVPIGEGVRPVVEGILMAGACGLNAGCLVRDGS